MSIKKGHVLKCWNDQSNTMHLTRGNIYTALEDQEPGIFESDPYVSVVGDMGTPITCHASRFEIIGICCLTS